jgi:hypothetical protein
MGIIFNADGTTTRTEEVLDLQTELADRLVNHNDFVRDHMITLRNFRDKELLASDWTQGEDSPLDSSTKTAWATYRQALRNMPGSSDAPIWFAESDIPKRPGAATPADGYIEFVKSDADALGIGTTSWVGLTTGIVVKNWVECDSVGLTSTGTGLSKIIGVASTDNIVVGDWVKTEDRENIGTVAGIGTTTITLDAVNSVEVPLKIAFARVEPQYYEQDRPQLSLTVTPQPYTLVGGNNVNFTITFTNQEQDQYVTWITNNINVGTNDGELTISPNKSTLSGVGTVTVSVPTVEADTTLEFTVDCFGLSGVTTSVGVSTV